LSAGKNQIFIAGVELPNWESFKTENTLDLNINKATVVWPDLKTMSLALKSVGEPVLADVQFKRDGVLFWRGYGYHRTRYVGNLGNPGDEFRKYQLVCVSNKSYLDREAFRKAGPNGGASSYYDVIYGGAIASGTSFTTYSTLASSVFNDVLACQKSPILTAGTVGPNNGHTTTPHVCLYLIRQKALAALAQLMNGSLWEVRFNPDNTVDFQNQVGNAASVRTFTEGDDMSISEDYGCDNLINDVVVCGGGSAQPNPAAQGITDYGIVAEDDTSGPSIRFTQFFNLSNIFDQTLLQTYADCLATDLQYSMFSYPMNVIERKVGVNWHLGDYVSVVSPTLGYNPLLARIQSETRSFDSNGGEPISLTLMPAIHEATLANTRLRALEYLLNSQTQNQQSFANTNMPSASQYPLMAPLPNTTSAGMAPSGGTANVTLYCSASVSGLAVGWQYSIWLAGTISSNITASLAGTDVTKSNFQFFSGAGMSVGSPSAPLRNTGSGSYDITDDLVELVFSFTNNDTVHSQACQIIGVGNASFPNDISGFGVQQPTLPN
jgi:hypothetical protein